MFPGCWRQKCGRNSRRKREQQETRFTELKLRVDHDQAELANAMLRFTYDAADPDEVKQDPISQVLEPGDGSLRIWNKNADQERNGKSITDDGIIPEKVSGDSPVP